MATSALRLGIRCWRSSQQCYLETDKTEGYSATYHTNTVLHRNKLTRRLENLQHWTTVSSQSGQQMSDTADTRAVHLCMTDDSAKPAVTSQIVPYRQKVTYLNHHYTLSEKDISYEYSWILPNNKVQNQRILDDAVAS